MGVYSEYLDGNLDFDGITKERKKQLLRISSLRERDVLVFAADLGKNTPAISIGYPDILPISDQLDNLSGSGLDLILESPGGSGEVAEDIIRLIRSKYQDLAVIIPGYAKSAATIMAMAGDDILMRPLSSLGPIDAQLAWQGKVFSADALLEGIERIKREVDESGSLNKAYIPILQGISPGELQSAENALKFAQALVKEWLAKYKFKDWTSHSSTGAPVTDDDKRIRAEEIAHCLCDHRRWLTHGRAIKLDDLAEMRLKVTDLSTQKDLSDAISRYYTLLQMTFTTNIYKVFETPTSQIYRFISPNVQPPQQAPGNVAIIEITCQKCGNTSKLQANLGKPASLQQGCLPFPKNNIIKCPGCQSEIHLEDARRQIEAQSKKPVVF